MLLEMYPKVGSAIRDAAKKTDLEASTEFKSLKFRFILLTQVLERYGDMKDDDRQALSVVVLDDGDLRKALQEKAKVRIDRTGDTKPGIFDKMKQYFRTDEEDLVGRKVDTKHGLSGIMLQFLTDNLTVLHQEAQVIERKTSDYNFLSKLITIVADMPWLAKRAAEVKALAQSNFDAIFRKQLRMLVARAEYTLQEDTKKQIQRLADSNMQQALLASRRQLIHDIETSAQTRASPCASSFKRSRVGTDWCLKYIQPLVS
jgi:hypothetical protein